MHFTSTNKSEKLKIRYLSWCMLFVVPLMLIIPVSYIDASQLKIRADGLFETAGVLVTLPKNVAMDTPGKLRIRTLDDSLFRVVLPLTRIDANNFAGNIFHLTPDTEYQIEVSIENVAVETSSFKTQSEFKMPKLDCNTTISAKDLQRVVDRLSSKAGKKIVQICVDGGTHGELSIDGIVASKINPFIIRAVPGSKPIINSKGVRGIHIKDSANVWIDGFTILGAEGHHKKGGFGIHIDTARGLVIRNNRIIGTTRWGILLNRSFRFKKGLDVENDLNLIEANTCEGHYNCIQFDNNRLYYSELDDVTAKYIGGQGLVIRNNVMSGGYDVLRLCGDESTDGGARQMPENVEHVLAQTGSGEWTTYNIAVYDNVIGNSKDDLIETDGICVALKVFRNKLYGHSANSISIAPISPGPTHYIGNILNVNPKQSFVKMNTAGDSNALSRNVFFYNNTMVRTGNGPLINAWYGKPGDHNVPIKNINFVNNIFQSKGKGRAIDVSIGDAAIENPNFDYNMWHSKYRHSRDLFEWWDIKQEAKVGLRSIAELRAFGVEEHGWYADPKLMENFEPTLNSPVVDSGVLIPGVTDKFTGKSPDIGASDLW